MSPTVLGAPSNAPSRAVTRAALYNLLLPLASGDYVEEVTTGTPGTQLNVQSPQIIILSAGSERDPAYRGTAQNETIFYLAVSVWVDRETPTADDVLDTIEKLITDIISTNRSFTPWHMIAGDGRSVIINSADKGGIPYHVETMPFVASVGG